MRSRTLLFAFALLISSAAAVHAKSYSADRFDSRIQVLRGGGIEVTETVVFRFDGTFSEVFRRIPRRRTDGIRIIRASMDGNAFPEGKNAGHYDVSSKDGQEVVRWRFAPVTDSVHTFELTYVARGVVQQDARGDLFAWRALPSRHDYRIATSTVEIDLPAAPLAAPQLKTSRVGSSRAIVEDTHVRVTASDIRSNGWLEAEIVLSAGSVLTAPSAWQARQFRARELVPTFATAAGILLFAGLVVLFALRQGYDSPPRESSATPTGPVPPDTYPPAIAGALTSNGRVGLEQGMATLFALADRGEVKITEAPKKWGQHVFEVEHTPTGQRLADYERAVIDTVFTGKRPESRVDLSKARSRVTRRFSKFSATVEHQMRADGLVDEGRAAVRKRFLAVGVGALVVGAAGMIPAALVVNRAGPWTLLVPAAVIVVGVIGLIMYAAHTPLSNEGLRRAREWRGFQKYLREVTRDRATVTDAAAARLLPFVVAVGLAHGWSSYLKKHRGSVPSWFRALQADSGAESFAFFVYTGGSGAGHGGAGGGGGGAAGGGASGAH